MNPASGSIGQGYELRRRRMVERLADMGIHNPQVLHAMNTVPRHLFVEEALQSRAYDNTALPLGLGQTISQPYTVALMTQLLIGDAPLPQSAPVLEIGTGCGYQTAILYALGLSPIYSIERLRALHERAKKHLRVLKTGAHVRLMCGDGYQGLPQSAPFRSILMSAAAKEIPVPLLQQLAIGGRVVLPLDDGGTQYLWLIEKTEKGYHEHCIQAAYFVPLVNDGSSF